MNTAKKRILTFSIQVIGIGLLIAADYFIKELVVKYLYSQPTVVLIKGVLGLTYAENTGAAFSLFSASTQVLSVFTGIALVAALVLLAVIKQKPKVYDICVPLIIAGGAGNLLDRLTRGFVVDYIHTLFVDFPIYNFADILITCSCAVIIIYLIYEIIVESRLDREKKLAAKSEISDNTAEVQTTPQNDASQNAENGKSI